MARTNMRLTAVYEPVENGWTQGRIAELPAVITAGPSLEETRELLIDALREYLLALGERAGTVVIHDRATRESLEVTLSA